MISLGFPQSAVLASVCALVTGRLIGAFRVSPRLLLVSGGIVAITALASILAALAFRGSPPEATGISFTGVVARMQNLRIETVDHRTVYQANDATGLRPLVQLSPGLYRITATEAGGCAECEAPARQSVWKSVPVVAGGTTIVDLDRDWTTDSPQPMISRPDTPWPLVARQLALVAIALASGAVGLAWGLLARFPRLESR